jgi:lysophospholipase L1-like esterase
VIKRWAGRLVLLVIAAALAVVGAELLLRILLPPMPEYVLPGSGFLDDSIFEYDILPLHLAPPGREEVIVGLVPGAVGEMRTLEYSTTVRVNSLGVRGPELAPKASGELRILAVGDSFTLGIQHEEPDTWTERLGAQLSERLGRPVTVVNAGVDDYGTDRATAAMQRLARPAQIDAVLLTFYTGNDFTDNRPLEELARALGVKGPGENPPPPPPPDAMETGWGPVLGRLSYGYAYYMASREARALAADPEATALFREQLRAFSDPALLERTAGYSRDALRRYHDACTRLGLRCFVAIAPPAFAVHTERIGPTWATYGLGEPPEDLDGPARALTQGLPQALPVLDLAPALRAASDRDLYFTFDGHWNAAGVEVVADALAEFLAPQLK